MSVSFDCNFFEIINTRKTIRKYKNEIPPLEAIKKIADAGRLAPSATNTQNWEFIAIFSDEIKEKMANAVENKFEKFQKLITNEEDNNKINCYKYYSMFFDKAPVVFAIVEKKRVSTMLSILSKTGMDKEEIQKYDNRSSILSMGAAIENMSLCAHALGLATCWMCAPMVAHEEFGKILHIEEDARVISLLTVGYPENNIPARPQKKTLDEVFRFIV